MWQETKEQGKSENLYRHFTFADFRQAFAFMTRVAEVADAINHHPRWCNEYNNVEIWLSTHSAGGKVTAKDRKLAAAIDSIYTELIV
jgi:4a-hydroxytetrahydrobiopterin dehydratase